MFRSTFSIAALVLIATPAAAKPPVGRADGPTAQVRYDDLNLGTASGRRALDSRIRDAANRLCEDPDVRDLGRMMLGDACFRRAVESARLQIAGVAAPLGTVRIAARPPSLVRTPQ